MFDVGDLIEPCSDQKFITPGLYEVLAINRDSARLSPRYKATEEDMEARVNRTTFVPFDVLKMFNRVRRRDS